MLERAGLRLAKHHALGNEFLIILMSDDEAKELDGRYFDWSLLARSVCRRPTAINWTDKDDWEVEITDVAGRYSKRGIGADGLIVGVLTHVAQPQWEQKSGENTRNASDRVLKIEAQARMRLFNADGTKAEYSGNGAACLANELARSGSIHDQLNNPLQDSTLWLELDTDAGRRTLTWHNAEYWRLRREAERDDDETILGRWDATWEDLDQWSAAVHMPDISPGPIVDNELKRAIDSRFPHARHATASVGNPHLVITTPRVLTADETAELGSHYASYFSGGINVEFVCHDGQGSFDMTVWERGVGVTSACGTGAVAATMVLESWEVLHSEPGNGWAFVQMPGGQAYIQWKDRGHGTRENPHLLLLPELLMDVEYPVIDFLPSHVLPPIRTSRDMR